MAKKKGRVKQDLTEWQKAKEKFPHGVQSISWIDNLPELLHISIATIESDYEKVRNDYITLYNQIKDKYALDGDFVFNLTHAIRLIKEHPEILELISKTCFKNAFHIILFMYKPLLNINIDWGRPPHAHLFLNGYKKILDGRSSNTIICKHIMIQSQHLRKEPLLEWIYLKTPKEILNPMVVSNIMAMFPIILGTNPNIDTNLCRAMWEYNYAVIPFKTKPDRLMETKAEFEETKVNEHLRLFKSLYKSFKKINYLLYDHEYVAEVKMGFIARVSDLGIDVVGLLKKHKGEIAELVIRTQLESLIVGAWLLKRNDIEQYTRFREFSAGKQKYFSDWFKKRATSPEMEEQADKIASSALKDAGLNSRDVAIERGEAFDLNIAQMAEEVFGKDNIYYVLYKRGSEVIHGHWRVMAKYHLSKSIMPTHNNLRKYNENPNKYAGVVPAFSALIISTDFIMMNLTHLDKKRHEALYTKAYNLKKVLLKTFKEYYKNNIMNGEEDS